MLIANSSASFAEPSGTTSDDALMVRQENGIQVRPGFRVERIYKVPKAEQGSWINLTFDDRGRMIAASENGKLYRMTVLDTDPVRVEPLQVEIDVANGLLVVDGALYLGANPRRNAKGVSGLYRLTDSDGDDQYDNVEHLLSYEGRGDHGPHAVILGPDKKSLYLCAGNVTDMPKLVTSRVPQKWQEDLLLPRLWDANGHMAGRSAPGGWIGKCDLDGKNFELVCSGFRNEFDIAFNDQGELFTYDADMEWDVGAPWYRPTRVCHVTSGGEFGWRSGAGKWPVYYLDSLPAVVDVGVGSPTGIVFGYGAKFPARYQRALLIADWSYGVIYATHLQPNGSTFGGRLERFVGGAPLQVTDLAVNPRDGHVYFAVGGRGTESAVYRISYVGDEPVAKVAPGIPNDTVQSRAARQQRRRLESMHHAGASRAVETAWPHLGSDDRHLAFAARIAIEHQPVETWQERAIAETRPRARLNALVALARCGDDASRAAVVKAVVEVAEAAGDVDEASRKTWLDICRVLEVAFSRMEGPPDELRNRVIAAVDARYPSGVRLVDQELAELLIYLEAPNVVERTLRLLEDSVTQQDQIHYAYSLRSLKRGWTLDTRRAYLDWFHQAGAHRGGASLTKYLKNIRGEFIEHLPDAARGALQSEIENAPQQIAPAALLESRPTVKEWTIEDLLPVLDQGEGERDFEQGRRMFAVAQCFRCHRVRGEGETVGPDLTGAGRRFGNRDLLTAMILPNETISDQYAQTVFVVDGRVVTGRVVNSGGGRIHVVTDMYEQDKQERIAEADIEESYPSNVSAMPSGLLNSLNQQEVLDLVAYLKAGGDPDHEIYRQGGPAAN